MKRGDSDRLRAETDSARAEAGELSNEHQARLAQLMTIWISGYLEATCREVFGAYVRRRSNREVFQFASRHLERFVNPNMRRIVDLVGAFDRDKARDLEEFVSGSIKDSVDGVVAQRHNIAHGRSSNTTVANVSQQFEDAKKLAGKLKDLFR